MIFYYIYQESSPPKKTGDRAQLISPIGQPDDGRCLEFWYHMYGTDIGSLNVYLLMNLTNGPSQNMIWSRGSNFGDMWRKAQISTDYIRPFQIVFEGVVGAGSFVSCCSMSML